MMNQSLRSQFYNLRNELDKKKVISLSVGDVACQKYYDLLPDIGDKVILDAGVGSGWLTRLLAQRQPAIIYGVDISTDRIAELTEHFKTLEIPHKFQAGSVEELSFIPDERIDFIACRDVLEHLTNPAACLREFGRILKPDGRLLLETPNDLLHGTLNLEHRFHEMFRFMLTGLAPTVSRDPFLGQDGRLLDSTRQELLARIEAEGIREHEKLWSPLELIRLLTENGFNVLALSGTPILAATFYQLGPQAVKITEFYTRFVSSEQYEPFLEALILDLCAADRVPEENLNLPVQYVLSDDLIALVEKKVEGRS